VVRAAAQAAVVVAQDERLRLLAGSALGRRTDQSKRSTAGVDDPRSHDQSPQVSGHGRGPDGGLQGVESAYLDVQVLLDGPGELSGLRRLDDLVDGAAAGVAQLISDLLIGQALQLELDRPALARRGQRSVPVPATDPTSCRAGS